LKDFGKILGESLGEALGKAFNQHMFHKQLEKGYKMSRLDRIEQRLRILTEQVDKYGGSIRSLLTKNKMRFDDSDTESCNVCGKQKFDHETEEFCDPPEDILY
jgi:hypothetical protein